MRRRRLRHQKCAIDIHIDCSSPIIRFYFVEWLAFTDEYVADALHSDASIVDQSMKSTEMIERPLDGLPALLPFCHIRFDREEATVPSFFRSKKIELMYFRSACRQMHYDHAESVAQQAQSHCAAKSACASSHDGNAARVIDIRS